MEIRNPRRILLLSSNASIRDSTVEAIIPRSVNEPKGPSSETAELRYRIETAYYKVDVPVWTDIIDKPKAWAEEWQTMSGAGEVVGAIAAWIVSFSMPQNDIEMKLRDRQNSIAFTYNNGGSPVLIACKKAVLSLLRSISLVRSHHAHSNNPDGDYNHGDEDRVIQVALLLDPSSTQLSDDDALDWEDRCQEAGGWEFVDLGAKGRNCFGEIRGLPRLKEILELAEWGDENHTIDAPVDLDLGLGDEDEDEPSAEDARDKSKQEGSSQEQQDDDRKPELEVLSKDDSSRMRLPLLQEHHEKLSDADGDDHDDDDVEALQRMVLKMQALRDTGVTMPEAQRKHMAAKAVREMMQEFN